ncbi:hypothetical protein MRX96_020067 [Rhipicephalus microplus]
MSSWRTLSNHKGVLANRGMVVLFQPYTASARVLYAVPLVALRPVQWAALDTLHRGVVRRLYGLPRSSPIGPTLAEAGETSLSLRARGSALRHIHRMYLTSEGRRLAGRLLDRPHSGMGRRALEYAALVPDPPYCGLIPIPPHQDPGPPLEPHGAFEALLEFFGDAALIARL